MTDERSWSEIRKDFRLSAKRSHFDLMLVASHPRPVREAIAGFRDQIDRNPGSYVVGHFRELEQRVLNAGARYLDVGEGQIARTDSTTMGLALLYNGISILPGQEVITTAHAFFSKRSALELRAQRDGVEVTTLPLYNDSATVTKREMIASIGAAISSRTRILALTWVHSTTGVKLPLLEIGQLVAEHNRGRPEEERVLVCLDGVHGLGVENVTFRDLACDFLVAGCHKWLLGPRGTGVVCARSGVWDQVRPTIPSFSRGTPGREHTPGGVHSYEYRWALAEAFDYHWAIGKARIEYRLHQLALRLKQGLASTRGVSLLTPMAMELSSGIVVADVEGFQASDVKDALARERVLVSISSDPEGQTHVRFAVSIVNSVGDIDRAVEAVARL